MGHARIEVAGVEKISYLHAYYTRHVTYLDSRTDHIELVGDQVSLLQLIGGPLRGT